MPTCRGYGRKIGLRSLFTTFRDDSRWLNAASSYLVLGARILDAQGTGHEGMMLPKRMAVK